MKYIPLLMSLLSLCLSIGLWLSDYRQEAMYVGIWVPTILCAANFLNAVKDN